MTTPVDFLTIVRAVYILKVAKTIEPIAPTLAVGCMTSSDQ